jgi:ketosteroid isomerase-like protein
MSNASSVADEIRALESQRYAAMIGRDLPALRALLHPGLVYTHSNAAVDSFESYVAGVENGRFNYRAVERVEETIQVHGDTAIVTGHVRIQVGIDGQARLLNSRFVDIWVRASGGWQMVAWQSTPIPA